MRLFSGGVAHLACLIEDDLSGRDTGLHKPHINALADLASCVLACRNANTPEWIAILPRKTQDAKSKERFISRFLSNKLIDPIICDERVYSRNGYDDERKQPNNYIDARSKQNF